jgi:phosphoglycolate phosphatase
MIKNIFFDFNGTILDDVKLCYEIESEMLAKYGLKDITFETYLDLFDFPVEKYYQKIGFSFSKVPYDELANYFMDEYTKREFSESKLYSGCKETLLALKEAGYKIYILSASEEGLLKNQLKKLGILEIFDGISACNDIQANGKAGYGAAFIKKNGIDPLKSCLIGDTVHDYEVAKKLDMEPILFTSGHNSLARLKKLKVKTAKNYKEIAELFAV